MIILHYLRGLKISISIVLLFFGIFFTINYLQQKAWIFEGNLRKDQYIVSSASISPHNQYLVRINQNGVPQVLDFNSSKIISSFRKHSGWVNSAEFSPDGELVVSAGVDKTVRIWNALAGEEVLVLQEPNYVYSANFAPNGNSLVTANEDSLARIWTFPDGLIKAVLKGHKNALITASYSPDGYRILTASWDGTARVWSAESGRVLEIFSPNRGTIVSAHFTPDNKRIILGFENQVAGVWVRQYDERPWRRTGTWFIFGFLVFVLLPFLILYVLSLI